MQYPSLELAMARESELRRTGFRFSSPLQADDGAVTATVGTRTVQLRPLRPGETAPQQAVFDGLSARSRHTRFLTGVHALTPAMWRSLGAVDGRRHVAWLASVDGKPAGVGRYVTTAPGTAEIAFEVVDEHQGNGIGALLLDTVTTVAVTLGIERLQASVLESNHASRHLLAALGLDLRPVGDGLLEAEGPFELLDPARVDRPLVAGIAQALLVTAATDGRVPRPMVA